MVLQKEILTPQENEFYNKQKQKHIQSPNKFSCVRFVNTPQTDSSEMQEDLSLKDHWGQLLEAVRKIKYQVNSNIIIHGIQQDTFNYIQAKKTGSITHTDSRIDDRKD